MFMSNKHYCLQLVKGNIKPSVKNYNKFTNEKSKSSNDQHSRDFFIVSYLTLSPIAKVLPPYATTHVIIDTSALSVSHCSQSPVFGVLNRKARGTLRGGKIA